MKAIISTCHWTFLTTTPSRPLVARPGLLTPASSYARISKTLCRFAFTFRTKVSEVSARAARRQRGQRPVFRTRTRFPWRYYFMPPSRGDKRSWWLVSSYEPSPSREEFVVQFGPLVIVILPVSFRHRQPRSVPGFLRAGTP